MRKGIVIGALVAALAATGASAGSSEPVAGTAAATADSAKDNFFSPIKAKVRKGGKVRWTNNGKVKHNATGDNFATGNFGPGVSRVVRFTRRGKFPYVCTIHAGMRGTVKVCPK